MNRDDVLVVVAAGHCPRCKWTLTALERVGVQVCVRRVDELTDGERTYLVEQGYRSAPVVITPIGDFTGAMTLSQARGIADSLAARRAA